MKYIIIFLAIMFVVLQYKIWLGDGNTFALYKFKKKVFEQTEINNQLSTRNAKLESEINDLKYGNSDSIEEIARSKLGMIKKGEQYFHFTSD